MKKKIILSTLIVLSAFFSVQTLTAEGETELSQRMITVRGTGSVSAAPDVVRLNLGVQSMNADLNTAISDNNERIDRIIEVIEDYGLSESEFSTSNFSVFYQQPFNAGTSPEDGIYNVNNNIFIQLKDVERIGGFIQDALAAGANQFYGLEYAVSDNDPLLKEARRLALENAKMLAAETADMAGVKLGRIISIEETPYYGDGMLYSAGLAASARGSNSITTVPGKKTIETQVTVKFAIE